MNGNFFCAELVVYLQMFVIRVEAHKDDSLSLVCHEPTAMAIVLSERSHSGITEHWPILPASLLVE